MFPPFLRITCLVSTLLAVAPAGAASSAVQPLNSSGDLAGLVSLRHSLGLRAADWPEGSEPCATWAGVVCRGGRVVALRLSGLNRAENDHDHAPARFAVDGLKNLTALEVFNASGFPLPGPIPAWFGGSLAGTVSVLDLHAAGINGSIPADLALLPALAHLDLADNALSGAFPASLWSSKTLHFLDLSRNNLAGNLPDATLPNAGKVTGTSALLNLSDNMFYGKVPDGIAALFQVADLSNNYFDVLPGAATAGGTVIVMGNCISNALGQKSPSQCAALYRLHGVSFQAAVTTTTPTMATSDSAPPAPDAGTGNSDNWKYILAGVLGFVALALIVLAVVLICMARKRRPLHPRSSSSPASPATAVRSPPPTKVFGYDQLVTATAGFSDGNLLKHGHSGDVYQGLLDNGVRVVVKRVTTKEAATGELEFVTKVAHPRVVAFLGHYGRRRSTSPAAAVAAEEEEEVTMLVYKYMPKGDLTAALHRKQEAALQRKVEASPEMLEEGMVALPPSLDWITRLKIATGVAEALCFLHHECDPPLVHRDVKASSVLLDDSYEVRLGSLSEVCRQRTEARRNVLCFLTPKSSVDKNVVSGPPAICSYDIYCLGKVLLELVTGNLGISDADNDDAVVAAWVKTTVDYISSADRESVAKIIDPLLVVDEDHQEEAWAVAVVAKMCLNPKPELRPPARQVLEALESPLKVVKEDLRNSSARFTGSSSSASRGSWRAAFRGSGGGVQRHVEMVAAVTPPGKQQQPVGSKDERRSSSRPSFMSHGSGAATGDRSFSLRKASREIAPEPYLGLDGFMDD